MNIRKLFMAFAFLFFVLGIGKADAQISSLSIDKTSTKIDSINEKCVGADMVLFRLEGSCTGTVGSTPDTLLINLNFGDGTDETYYMPIHSIGKFDIKIPMPKTYTTPGVYTTKLKVHSVFTGLKDSMSSAPFTVLGTSAMTSIKPMIHTASFDSIFVCNLSKSYSMGSIGFIYGCLKPSDSVKVNYNFGDGFDTTITVSVDTATSYFKNSYAVHAYTLSGTYTPRITFLTSGSAVLADTFYFKPYTITDSCASVSGKLYVDDNKNCIKNVGEDGLWYIPFRVINTITGDTTFAYRYSDTAGYYALNLVPGTYSITPLVNRAFGSGGFTSKGDTLKPTCPSSGSTSITVTASSKYIQDFAYECTPVDSFDATVNVSSNCYVPGDTSVMKVWAGDWWRVFYYNCLSLSTSVTLTLDSKLSYVGNLDGKAPASIVGKVITWNLSGSDLALFSGRIKVAVATTATLGDTIKSLAYIVPATGIPDPNTLNNTHNYSREVVSAFDPNMKESAPNGKGKQGYIAKNTPMTYTIHFQNTGTAPARNITVVDTLEKDLLASSFHMMSSTHNAVVYQDGNVIKFRFNNIYLPDSGSNYYGSMGSVTFGILPVRDLAPGTEIKNRAGIYFDYNDPVITNYALNTIEIPTNIQHISVGNISAQVFPNPANNTLNIKMENNSDFSVLMTDMLGRTVAFQNTNNGAVVVPTQALSAGMYLINIKDAKGNELNTKVVVKH